MKYIDKIFPTFFVALAMVYAISCSSTPSRQIILIPVLTEQPLVILDDCAATLAGCSFEPYMSEETEFTAEMSNGVFQL